MLRISGCFAALLWLMCSVFIGLVFLYNPTLIVVTNQYPGFTTCELPCWAGIQPGTTSYDQAAQIVRSNLGDMDVRVLANADRMDFAAVSATQTINGAFFEDRGQVGDIRLEVALPLWELLDTLGKPYCIRTDYLSLSQLDVINIHWALDDMLVIGVVILANASDWNLKAETNLLYIIPDNHACETPGAVPWRGIIRVNYYSSQQLTR